MRIEKDIIKQGYWWLPDKPENKLFGTLKISVDGSVSLDIHGLLRVPYGEFGSYTVFEYEKIFGETEDGKPVILLNCFETNSSIRVGGGISQTSVNSKFAFIGTTSKSIDKLEFSKVIFSFEGLSEWLNISGIEVSHNLEEKKGEIKYEVPESILYTLEDDVKFSFDFILNFNSLTRHLIDAKVSQKEFIALEFPKPLEIYSIIQIISRILKFFCFATDKSVSMKSLTAIYSNEEQDEYTEIYYRSSPYSEKSEKMDIHLMLFHFSQICDDFQKLLNNWLKSFDFLEPTFNLYFFTIQNTRNLESHFLFLAQAIETFHRRTCDEHLFDEPDFDELSAILREGVNNNKDEYKDWVENKLRYGNELTLRKRLKKLIEPFNHLFGSKSDRNSFINQFLNTRNYLTHYDKSLETSACKDEELLNLGRKCEALLQLHLLKCIEFPEILFEEVFNNRISGKLKYSQRLL